MPDTWIDLDLSLPPPPAPAAALEAALARGDLDAAAHAYEGLPPDDAARWAEAQGGGPRLGEAAEVCRRARDFARAALLFERAGDAARAASLYEQSGQFEKAAYCHHRSGDLARAGAAYERAGRVERALLFYQQAGAHLAAAECLAGHERYAEAAALYRKLGNRHAEAAMLRQVPELDPAWPACARRLAALLAAHDQPRAALELLTRLARRDPAARADPQVVEAAAALLERLGKPAEAARVRAQKPAAPVSATAPVSAPAPEEAEGPVLLGQAEEGAAELLDPASPAYQHLKRLPIFANLALEDLRDLYRIAQEVGFAPGAVLIEQGQPGRGLMVLWEGAVEVFRVGEKGGTFLNRLEAGGYVGEISLVRDEPTTARVVAAGPVRVLFLSREAFGHYLEGHPLAALRIYEVFTQDLAGRVRVLSG